jgi:hypothetical protein
VNGILIEAKGESGLVDAALPPRIAGAGSFDEPGEESTGWRISISSW